MTPISLSISTLHHRYRSGDLTPAALIDQLWPLLAAEDTHRIWITRVTREQLAPYLDALAASDPATRPLYGIPFAIKDNIDLAGVPTTAGCPAFPYVPERSATTVQRLIDAGAIPLGKTISTSSRKTRSACLPPPPHSMRPIHSRARRCGTASISAARHDFVSACRARDLAFFGNADYERLFAAAVERMQALGGTAVEFDLQTTAGGGPPALRGSVGGRTLCRYPRLLRCPRCRHASGDP